MPHPGPVGEGLTRTPTSGSGLGSIPGRTPFAFYFENQLSLPGSQFSPSSGVMNSLSEGLCFRVPEQADPTCPWGVNRGGRCPDLGLQPQ